MRFMYRLFLTFLFTGVVPVIILSTSFVLLSSRIMENTYGEEAERTVARVAEEFDALLDRYRHISYSVSRDDTVTATLQETAHPTREELLRLYRIFYTSLAGSLEHASLHVINLTGTESFSTHTVPPEHLQEVQQSSSTMFSKARREQGKSIISMRGAVHGRVEQAPISVCNAISTQSGAPLGYVVVDINRNHIAETCEAANHSFFNGLIIADIQEYLCVDLFHSENDGNFSNLPFLTSVPDGITGRKTETNKIIAFHPAGSGRLSVIGTLPYDAALAGLHGILTATIWIILLCLILSTVLAAVISRSIFHPVGQLVDAMKRVEDGDLEVRIPAGRKDELGHLFHSFNIMIDQLDVLMKKKHEEQQHLRTAERKALLSQINPHFFYNTLTTIKSLAKLHNVEEISAIATRMGKLMRSAVDNTRELVSVTESIALVESYLEIQKIRYKQKIHISIDIPAELNQLLIPKLILQPIVENAVVHGLEKKVGIGKLSLHGMRCDSRIVFTIQDNGVGFDCPAGNPETIHEGVGLGNVHRRLQLLYGEEYGLEIQSTPGFGTTVTVSIPIQEAEQNDNGTAG